MKTAKISVKDGTREILEPLTTALDNRSFQDIARYLQAAQRGECLFIVGFINDQPVGYCLVYWASEFPNFQKYNIPEIVDLIVAQQYQRNGAATKILQEIETRLIVKNYTQVGLSVSDTAQPAKSLYQKRGYTFNQSLESGNLMLVKNLLSS